MGSCVQPYSTIHWPRNILGSSYTTAPIGQLRMTTSLCNYMYTFSSVSLGLLWRHLLARAGPAVNSPSRMTAHTRSNGPTTPGDHILITGQTTRSSLLYITTITFTFSHDYKSFSLVLLNLIFLKFTKNLHQDYLHYIFYKIDFIVDILVAIVDAADNCYLVSRRHYERIIS